MSAADSFSTLYPFRSPLASTAFSRSAEESAPFSRVSGSEVSFCPADLAGSDGFLPSPESSPPHAAVRPRVTVTVAATMARDTVVFAFFSPSVRVLRIAGPRRGERSG
ncbi:hypothetical protein SALBM135S_04798 [Streptomyces alboniger]